MNGSRPSNPITWLALSLAAIVMILAWAVRGLTP